MIINREDSIVEINENKQGVFGTAGKMLIPCPATIEKQINEIPLNLLLTIDQLRKNLAIQFKDALII